MFPPCAGDSFCMCKDRPIGDLVPNCDDCSSYYLCGNNSIELVQCGPGLVFDIIVNACVPGTCPRVDGECPKPDPDPTTTPPGPASCTNTAVKCAFDGQMLPNALHCQRFWICLGLCPFVGFCEPGKWFDRALYVCDFPKNVNNCPANVD